MSDTKSSAYNVCSHDTSASHDTTRLQPRSCAGGRGREGNRGDGSRQRSGGGVKTVKYHDIVLSVDCREGRCVCLPVRTCVFTKRLCSRCAPSGPRASLPPPCCLHWVGFFRLVCVGGALRVLAVRQRVPHRACIDPSFMRPTEISEMATSGCGTTAGIQVAHERKTTATSHDFQHPATLSLSFSHPSFGVFDLFITKKRCPRAKKNIYIVFLLRLKIPVW